MRADLEQLQRENERLWEERSMGTSFHGRSDGEVMDSQMLEESQSRMREIEKKALGSAETARITAAGTAGRQETLNAQGVINEHGTNLYLNSGRSDFSYRTPLQRWSSSTINSNNNYVHFPFCNGHRRYDRNFPGGNVGQQQLWTRGGNWTASAADAQFLRHGCWTAAAVGPEGNWTAAAADAQLEPTSTQVRCTQATLSSPFTTATPLPELATPPAA